MITSFEFKIQATKIILTILITKTTLGDLKIFAFKSQKVAAAKPTR